MKNSIYSSGLILFFLLISCTSDDVNVDDSHIVGIWKLTEWNVKTPLDLNNDGIASSNLLTEFGCLNGSALVFNDAINGTLFYSSDVGFHTGIESEDEIFNGIICSTSSERLPSLITYVKIDNTVTINNDGDLSDLTLEGNTLSMFIQDGFVAYDVNTFEISVILDATYVFTKE